MLTETRNVREMKQVLKTLSTCPENSTDKSLLRRAARFYPKEMSNWASLWGQFIGFNNRLAACGSIGDFLLDMFTVVILYLSGYHVWAVVDLIHLLVVTFGQGVRGIYIFKEYYDYNCQLYGSGDNGQYRYEKLWQFLETGSWNFENNDMDIKSHLNLPPWTWIYIAFPKVVLLNQVVILKNNKLAPQMKTLQEFGDETSDLDRDNFFKSLAEFEFLKFQIGEFAATELFMETILQLICRFIPFVNTIWVAGISGLSFWNLLLCITFVITGYTASSSAENKLEFYFLRYNVEAKMKQPILLRMPEFSYFNIVCDALLIFSVALLVAISVTVNQPWQWIIFISDVAVVVLIAVIVTIIPPIRNILYKSSSIRCYSVGSLFINLFTSYAAQKRELGLCDLVKRNILKLIIFSIVWASMLGSRLYFGYFHGEVYVYFGVLWGMFFCGLSLSIILRMQWISKFGSHHNFQRFMEDNVDVIPFFKL